MTKIGIIGFGNMGGALASGLLAQSSNYEIRISEIKEEKITLAREKYAIANVPNKAELIKGSDIIIIAVKPQELPGLFKEINTYSKDKQIISLCAGRKIGLFRENLKTELVCRFMPNLAAMEGKSVVGISFSDKAGPGFKEACLEIAGAIGMACEIPENLMPAITGISGSGIAFVWAFMHAMALGGTASGISYNQSLDIVCKTMEGALAVLEKNRVNPIEMLSRVISPAGTTIKGVEALENGKFSYTVMDAILKTTQRASELEG